MLGNIRKIAEHEFYELYCSVCKRPKGQCCSGPKLSGYCDQYPVSLPVNSYAISGGINWCHVVCSSKEIAEEVSKSITTRQRPIVFGVVSFDGIQVAGYCFSYHR